MSATNERRRTFREQIDDLTDEPDAPEPELVPPPVREAPPPVLHPAALHGLAGEVVRAIAPTTEADPVATLATFLVMVGNAIGRGPYVAVGDVSHGTNLNAAVVGETARTRKGSSVAGPRRILARADPVWTVDRVVGGLSSGEGLIWAVRDETKTFDRKSGELVTAEPAVADKRLMVVEEEFSQVLKTSQRQGATVSEIIRRAWDAPDVLQTMTKNSPAKASGAHISIVGHITKAELLRELSDVSLANGLANRFLWLRVRRAQLLPRPVGMDAELVNDLGVRVARVLAFAKEVGAVPRDRDADELWDVAYRELERDRPGLVGAITARSSPIVLRLSLIYAPLECSRVIRPAHLEAALAIWDFSEQSVTSIFGDLTGDAIADRILSLLATEGRQSRNDLMDGFGRNISSARLGHAIDLLHASGRIQVWKVAPAGGRGRPVTYYNVAPKETGRP